MLVPLGVAATAGGRTIPEFRSVGEATLIYLAIYVAMNLGAFACAIAVTRRAPRGAIADVRGLARRAPWLAVAFALFLTALAGLPPGVAGLFAKVVVLREAVHGHVTWLAVVAAVNTVIGLAYYLRVAALMFAAPDDAPAAAPAPPTVPVRRSPTVATGLALALAATVALSVYPQPVFDWARHAAGATNAANP
jgi:NADH-quinone oxidoreductase subunit N